MNSVATQLLSTLPPTTDLSAAGAYALHQQRLVAMLAWMEGELEVHCQRAAAAPQDGTLVSDLAEAGALVRRALVRLSGMDELKVQVALAAMRED